jgi:hypothetical protein
MAASIALVLVGCSTSGVPRGAQVVGGGPMISWNAPANGTAYLAETTTHKIIVTVSMKKDEPFVFDTTDKTDSKAPEIIQAAFPVMPSNPKFVLYFLSSHD